MKWLNQMQSGYLFFKKEFKLSGRNSPKGSVYSLSPVESGCSSSNASKRSSFASCRDDNQITGDGGGSTVNDMLVKNQHYSNIQLTELFLYQGKPQARITLKLPPVAKSSVTPIHESEWQRDYSHFFEVSLPNLPYESEDIPPSYMLDTFGDAWRFQLLLVARWAQQVLANDESSDKLRICASQMQSSGEISFLWEEDSKQTPNMIPLQDEEKMFAYGFIPAVLGLFTLSREDLVQYCNDSISQQDQSEDKRKEMKELFSRVSQELELEDVTQKKVGTQPEEKSDKRTYLSGNVEREVNRTEDPKRAFVVDHFFNKLEEHNNILELIKNIDTILDTIFAEYKTSQTESSQDGHSQDGHSQDEASQDESSQNEPLVNFLRVLFLSMVGSYFAVLPAVKHRDEFIEKYQLERDFKLVKDADGSFSREYTQQEEITDDSSSDSSISDESSTSICSRLMNSAVDCFCCFFRKRQESTREDQKPSSQIGNNHTV